MGRVQDTGGWWRKAGGRVGDSRGKMWGEGECQGNGESGESMGRVR